MASVISEMPKSTRKSKYPWSEWTDGKARKATKGQDFDGTAISFRQALYAHANNSDPKLTVETQIVNDNEVLFKFTAKKQD